MCPRYLQALCGGLFGREFAVNDGVPFRCRSVLLSGVVAPIEEFRAGGAVFFH
jgi:hypothetical protein